MMSAEYLYVVSFLLHIVLHVRDSFSLWKSQKSYRESGESFFQQSLLILCYFVFKTLKFYNCMQDKYVQADSCENDSLGGSGL